MGEIEKEVLKDEVNIEQASNRNRHDLFRQPRHVAKYSDHNSPASELLESLKKNKAVHRILMTKTIFYCGL